MLGQEDLLSSAEAALEAGISRRTLYRWVEAGRLIPVDRLPGATGDLVFRRDDVKRAALREELPGGSLGEVSP